MLESQSAQVSTGTTRRSVHSSPQSRAPIPGEAYPSEAGEAETSLNLPSLANPTAPTFNGGGWREQESQVNGAEGNMQLLKLELSPHPRKNMS